MNSSTESSVSLPPKNYYFYEQEVSPLILQFQKINDRKLELESLVKDNVDLENNQKNLDKLLVEHKALLSIIMESTCKVIKGVIFRARLHKREKFDLCYQIAIEACIKALPRFKPESGTAFNYLSLTAKKSIIYYLIKKAKKRNLSLEYEYIGDDNLNLKNIIRQEEKTIRNLEIENLVDSIQNMISEDLKFKNLGKVVCELKDYLFYTQGKYEKKDFFKWAKSDGISSNLLRKFIKFLKENKEILYDQVGVY
jgi:hypothetical protein